MKYFYTHLVEVESIIVKLDNMKLSDKERLHLANLFDSTIHHTILDTVLSNLKDSDKRLFVNHMSENNHDKIWKFLKEKIDNIEEKIKISADLIKKEFENDLKEAEKLL